MRKEIEEAIEDLKYAKSSVSFFGQERSLDLAIESLEKVELYEKVLKQIKNYEAYGWDNDRKFIDSRIKALKLL